MAAQGDGATWAGDGRRRVHGGRESLLTGLPVPVGPSKAKTRNPKPETRINAQNPNATIVLAHRAAPVVLAQGCTLYLGHWGIHSGFGFRASGLITAGPRQARVLS